jgi:hypothetical protein
VTPPETILVNSPLAISGPSVTFIVDSSEAGSTFRCSLDTTTLASCAATTSYMSLAAGSHTFRAAAVDMAGNEDQSPVVYTWTVDVNALDTAITMGPGPTSGPNTSFRFTSTRTGTFECILEPVETVFSTCSTPKPYGPLAERPAPGYTFRVRAKDTAGNLDPTPAQQSFAVDATGPVINIATPAANATVGTTVTLTINTEPGATYTCQLDSQAVISPCASPRSFSGLTSAMGHTLKVTGTDPFGNVSTQSVPFTVDDIGPSVLISGAPAAGATVSSTSAALTFAPIPSNEPAPFSFECKFNAATTFTACASFSTSGLIEGTQTLQVRAKDRFGNIGGVVTHSWTVAYVTTTINAIRLGSITLGTRVRIVGPRMTGKTFNRFWMQDVDGNSTTPSPDRHGITVAPVPYNASDAMLTPGRSLTVIGTVAEVNGNTTLINASYFPGALQAAYNPRNTNRDSLVLLSEVNEGLFVNMAGRASNTAAQSCQDYDFCIVSCESSTPVINSTDGVISGAVEPNEDHFFEGIVEGEGSSFTYYVITANEGSDACL